MLAQALQSYTTKNMHVIVFINCKKLTLLYWWNTTKRVGSVSGPRGLGFRSFGVRTQGVWFLPCPDQRGVGSVPKLKGVGRGGDPRGLGPCPNQRGWGLGLCQEPGGGGSDPSVSRPNGFGFFHVRTQGGWAGGDPRGLGDGSVFGPKGLRIWVRSRNQGGWGLGHVRTQGVRSVSRPRGWGLGSSVSGPKGFGSFGVWTQGIWGLSPCPDPIGVGSMLGTKGVGG
jgi:hypothetical protein